MLLIPEAEVSVAVCEVECYRQEAADTGAALGCSSLCAADPCKSMVGAPVLVGCCRETREAALACIYAQGPTDTTEAAECMSGCAHQWVGYNQINELKTKHQRLCPLRQKGWLAAVLHDWRLALMRRSTGTGSRILFQRINMCSNSMNWQRIQQQKHICVAWMTSYT